MYSKAYGEPEIQVTSFGKAKPISPRSRSSPFKPSTVQKYDGASVDRRQISLPPGLEKVVVSRDGQRVYTGGKGLHILSSKNGSLTPIKIDTQGRNLLYLI